MAPILHADSCNAGGGGSFACDDLADCTLAQLGDVEATMPGDGDVLTWIAGDNAWGSLPPAGGGGVRDFGESIIAGGNGATPADTPGAVTGPGFGAITVAAAVGDLVEVSWNAITFGNQTFYSAHIAGAGAPRNSGFQGWYHTTNLTNQGEGTQGPWKFRVLSDDLDAGGTTVTVSMFASTTGGAGIVLEGSVLQVTNYGPVGA